MLFEEFQVDGSIESLYGGWIHDLTWCLMV
jgi:hypothetical protein